MRANSYLCRTNRRPAVKIQRMAIRAPHRPRTVRLKRRHANCPPKKFNRRKRKKVYIHKNILIMILLITSSSGERVMLLCMQFSIHKHVCMCDVSVRARLCSRQRFETKNCKFRIPLESSRKHSVAQKFPLNESGRVCVCGASLTVRPYNCHVCATTATETFWHKIRRRPFLFVFTRERNYSWILCVQILTRPESHPEQNHRFWGQFRLFCICDQKWNFVSSCVFWFSANACDMWSQIGKQFHLTMQRRNTSWNSPFAKRKQFLFK